MVAFTHLSLFSGIGGIDLAAEWAGFRTVAFCERDPFCQRVLAHHWPGVPIHDDIHALTVDALAGLGPIDLLTGGFPCQPFSDAGKRGGQDDDRYLWPEMLRVVEAVRPAWVCAENVTGIIRLALDDVLDGLEAAGYSTGSVVLPAAGVGAPHGRHRVFILAHAGGERAEPRRAPGDVARASRAPEREARQRQRRRDAALDSGAASALADAGRPRLEGAGLRRPVAERGGGSIEAIPDTNREREPQSQGGIPEGGRRFDDGGIGRFWVAAGWPDRAPWGVEPAVGRMVDGLPVRVAEPYLRALGNAVVPQQVYPILRAIAEQLTCV